MGNYAPLSSLGLTFAKRVETLLIYQITVVIMFNASKSNKSGIEILYTVIQATRTSK